MSWAVTWILIRFKSNSNHETSHWVLLTSWPTLPSLSKIV